MSVVGIITIIGVIIGPGFKKAYEDFLLQKTLLDADILLQSYRSYYLIYNEFSEDTNRDYVVKDVANFLPSNFFKKTKMSVTTNGESSARSVYQLVVKSFNDSELLWDFNNWTIWASNTTEGWMYLSLQSLQGSQKINSCVDALKKQYSLDRPQLFCL